MDSVPPTDDLGRQPISNWMRAKIDQELSGLPKDKRGAVIVVANEQGATAHLAARIGDHWKVAAGGGFRWDERRPTGEVSVEFAW